MRSKCHPIIIKSEGKPFNINKWTQVWATTRQVTYVWSSVTYNYIVDHAIKFHATIPISKLKIK